MIIIVSTIQIFQFLRYNSKDSSNTIVKIVYSHLHLESGWHIALLFTSWHASVYWACKSNVVGVINFCDIYFDSMLMLYVLLVLDVVTHVSLRCSSGPCWLMRVHRQQNQSVWFLLSWDVDRYWWHFLHLRRSSTVLSYVVLSMGTKLLILAFEVGFVQ